MPKIDPQTLILPRPAVPRSLYMRLIHQSSLPPTTRFVLVTIAWSAHSDGTGSYLSLAAISSRTGLSSRHAQRIIASAKKVGWLESSPHPGRVNGWVLAAPATALEGCRPRQGGGDTHVRGG